MVCIACISNVNQLGSSCHCDVMAQHLRGNREGGFLYNLWIFKMPIFSSQMLEINTVSQQEAFLHLGVQKLDVSLSFWLRIGSLKLVITKVLPFY